MTLDHSPERDQAYVEHAETLPVYFAYSEALKLVKIGFSSNVRQRLGSLVTDRPDCGRMFLIGWVLGGPRLEAELHDQFADFHEQREWFYPSPAMAEFIDEEGEEGDPPVLSSGPYRISTRAYWAARRRLAMVTTVEEVVHDFGNGLAFRTQRRVSDLQLPNSVVGLGLPKEVY